MPQGRRKPFSGKAKKLQMQNKKRRNQSSLDHYNDHDNRQESSSTKTKRMVQKINKQPKDTYGKNRYTLQFFEESEEELQRRKLLAKKLIEPLPLCKQEVSDNYYPSDIDMPKRPPWDFNMTKKEVLFQEQEYYVEYLKNMEMLQNISYFELNLETWRQLWRVLEMSDILLIIVDIRYPVCMFPPYLYQYVTDELKKDMILVLNKIDLASPALVLAWKKYFHKQYPKLHVLMFTSYPSYNLRHTTEESAGVKKTLRKGKLRMAAEGAQKLLEKCESIVSGQVDLSSWHEKIQEEMNLEYDVDIDDIEKQKNVVVEKADTTFFKHEKYKNGILTIGCIGTPNVGKSSLMNALMGKKVVSVSRTPGHTKHFQTIFLTKNVRLCDCPGLVFPSKVPKQLQILMGSFPIAQVKEPYTTVRFLAERLDLPKLLKLQHQDNDTTWSAMDICDSWAAKRHFMTAKAARLDAYRAANSILRMALEGQLCIYVYPPKWSDEQGFWQTHPELDAIGWIQARNKEEISNESQYCFQDDDNDTEGEENDQRTDSMSSEEEDSDVSSDEELNTTIVNKFEALSSVL